MPGIGLHEVWELVRSVDERVHRLEKRWAFVMGGLVALAVLNGGGLVLLLRSLL